MEDSLPSSKLDILICSSPLVFQNNHFVLLNVGCCERFKFKLRYV